MKSAFLADDLDVVRLRLLKIAIIAFEKTIELSFEKRPCRFMDVPGSNGSCRVMDGTPGNGVRDPGPGDQLAGGLVTLLGVSISRIGLGGLRTAL